MKKSTAKSALAFIKGDQTTYEERSDLAKRESVDLLMTQGITDFDAGVEEINDSAKGFIRGCNKIREACRKFEEAEKTGQIEFRGWHTDVVSWKQEALRREKIKAAQKVYRIMEVPAAKMDDCAPVMRALFELSGVMEKTRRNGDETAHEQVNPFNASISTAATLETWLRKMEPAETPIEDYYSKCEIETRQKLEQAFRPFAERHAILKRLLE